MMKHEKFYGRGGAALPCANDEGDPVIMAFKYEITERIAVLSTNSSGWERQLNLISWNDMSRSTTSVTGPRTAARWARASA